MRNTLFCSTLLASSLFLSSCAASGHKECESLLDPSHCYSNMTVAEFHQQVKSDGNPERVQYVPPKSIEREIQRLTPDPSILTDLLEAGDAFIPEGYRITDVDPVIGKGEESDGLITLHFIRIE